MAIKRLGTVWLEVFGDQTLIGCYLHSICLHNWADLNFSNFELWKVDDFSPRPALLVSCWNCWTGWLSFGHRPWFSWIQKPSALAQAFWFKSFELSHWATRNFLEGISSFIELWMLFFSVCSDERVRETNFIGKTLVSGRFGFLRFITWPDNNRKFRLAQLYPKLEEPDRWIGDFTEMLSLASSVLVSGGQLHRSDRNCPPHESCSGTLPTVCEIENLFKRFSSDCSEEETSSLQIKPSETSHESRSRSDSFSTLCRETMPGTSLERSS